MKTTLLTGLCSIALGLSVFGQTPTAPATSASLQPSPATSLTAASPSSAMPSVATSPTPDRDESIQGEVSRKLKRKFGIDIDMDHGTTHISRHHNGNGNGDTD